MSRKRSSQRKVALRLLDLLDAVLRNSFDRLGKPEPLKHLGPGIWSRRITPDHDGRALW
ncbi:MAG TPA: type II toxin-antitoxin system YoeB family toxin [Thermoanaerobaculia bacterium]